MTRNKAIEWTGSHFPSLLLGILSVSGAAFAQGFESPRALHWPAELDGAFGKTLVGDLTGDGVPEAVVMSGSYPIVLYGANDYGLAIPIWTQPDDIAIHNGVGPDLADAVLTVGTQGGVQRWTWAGEWDFVAETIDGAWTTPRRIALDGNVGSQYRYAAVLDGTEIHTLLLFPGFDMPVASFQLPQVAGEIAVADLDGDGAFEVVATYGGGLWISSLNGDNNWTVARAPGAVADLATERVVVFRNANESFDRLAWLANGGLGGQSLTLVDAAGAQAIVDLAAWDVVDLAAGFAGSDALADLCLTLSGSQSAVVMLNGSGAPVGMDFSIQSVLHLGSTIPGSTTARATFHDIDNDGDDDVLLPSQSPLGSAGVVLFESLDVSAGDMGPTLAVCLVGIIPFGHFGYFCMFDLYAPISVPSGATGYELKVWKQETVEDETTWLPVLEAEYAIGSSSWFNLFFVTDPPGSGEEHAFDVRHIEFRYVRRMPGEPVVAYPPLQASVSAYHIEDVGIPPVACAGGAPRPKEGGIITDLPPPPFPPVPLPDPPG